MSTPISKDTQSTIICGLGTFVFTCPSTSSYSISAVSTFLPPSGLSIVLKHNASTLVTVASPSAAQQTAGASSGPVSCSASDTLSVVLTSANINDQQFNTVKTIISINGPGQSLE